MANLQSPPGLMQAGRHKQYVSDAFETNIKDLNQFYGSDSNLKVEVLGSVMGTGIENSSMGLSKAAPPDKLLVSKYTSPSLSPTAVSTY